MKQVTGSGTMGGGRTRKHAGSGKHRHSVSKHNPMHGATPPGQVTGHGTIGPTPPGRVHAVAKMTGPAKPRKLSPGADVACCSAQALGTLLGWDWQQVLELYWRTADNPDAGAAILSSLQALKERPETSGLPFREAPLASLSIGAGKPGVIEFAARPAQHAGHGLILGVELPGPHAVAVTPDGRWWSWGEPFTPDDWPGLIVEEAWALSWR